SLPHDEQKLPAVTFIEQMFMRVELSYLAGRSERCDGARLDVTQQVDGAEETLESVGHRHFYRACLGPSNPNRAPARPSRWILVSGGQPQRRTATRERAGRDLTWLSLHRLPNPARCPPARQPPCQPRLQPKSP